MPDIWTHILCGKDVVNGLEKNFWKETIIENIKVFNLGCQGPDIFLYNDFWPWIKEKRGIRFGRLIHLKKTGEFFVEGLKFLKNNIKEDKDYKILFTYLSGFICHFALDRNAHPYIHYFAGAYDRNNPETYKYSLYHKKLELIIDSILVKEKRQIESWKYPVTKEINIGKTLPTVIVVFYHYILNRLFKFNKNINFIKNSYRDMIRVLNILYDPLGIKGILFKLIQIISGREIDYTTLMYPRNINKNVDYLNRNHNIWNHPCDRNEIYVKSFDDIYNRAVEESKYMIRGAVDYLENKIDISSLKIYFPNISYSTGRPVEDECQIKYFNCIFE